MPEVSLITPVYNAEATVSRMMDSILAQTMSEWELIVVDDGSTDGTSVILDDYANRDERIKVFHKSNEGVAMARQLGMENAIGEYFIHADADDWVEPTMLEEMYNKAREEDADVVISDFIQSSGSREKVISQIPNSNKSHEILKQIFHGGIFAALWNKLIRTSLYEKYKVQFFPDVNYCEDVLCCVQILKNPDVRVSYLPKAYYHYVINPMSISHRMTRKTYLGLQKYLVKIEECLYEPEWYSCVEKAKLGVFLESFRTKGVMTDMEIAESFAQIESVAFSNPSIRWKLGYLMVKLGFYSIARKLLKY